MVYNESLKRYIPVDWEIKTLKDLLEECSVAFDYKTEQPTIDLSVMPSNQIALNQLNTSSNFSTNLFVMKKGDILFGSIRPYLHKAGIAPCNGTVAGTVHSFRTKLVDDYNFCVITMTRSSFFDYAVNVSSGTKMPVVSSESLLSYKVAYSRKVVSMFNQLFDLQNIISNNVMETQSLIKIRDFLLPMLMNGQATIAE
jgi:type I restriction enzyme S subunit